MRILAFTDIHGSYDRVIEILSNETGFDAIIVGGDLTTHGTVSEATNAIRRFQQFKRPLFVVAGNMDLPSFDASFESLGVNINAKGATLGEAGFFGIAGSPFTPMHTPYEISEEEIRRRADAGWRDIRAMRWKVFVPHAPPRDTSLDKILLGKHVGSTAVREFVEKHQPDVLVCGHIHESRGLDVLGNTKMVNCGAAGRGFYALLELGDEISIELRG
ncbi:MAG: metallophosphoesterase [Ignavibacteria bacterium]|nr:metallophosphoesterase [Ignavibacteria bacterium]